MLNEEMSQQSNRDLLKRTMFDRGVLSAKEIKLVDKDLYICPICGNCYDVEDLLNGKLLPEHVPQRALRGKPLTLTCKDCNTRKLSYADSQLVQRERGLAFLESIYSRASESKQWFKIKLEDTEVNALISVTNGRVEIHVPGKHNKPESAEAYKDVLRKKPTDLPFSFTSRLRYNPWFSNLADLKNAFLYCFALFGYTYALHELHYPIRKQLYTPECKDISFFWFAKKREERNLIGIALSTAQPVHIIVFLRRTKIALPWFTEATSLYQHFRIFLDSGQSVQYTIERMFPLPRHMNMLLDKRH